VMKAVIWYAFQHDIAHYIGTSSYMWRAAMMMHKPHAPAKSVCEFFGINSRGKKDRQVGTSEKSCQAFHGDIRLIFLEEGGTIDLTCLQVILVERCLHAHLDHSNNCVLTMQDMHSSATTARDRHRLPHAADASFQGGYHFVAGLDFSQHEPVKGEALFARADWCENCIQNRGATAGMEGKKILGHRLWQKIDKAIILDEQFRFG